MKTSQVFLQAASGLLDIVRLKNKFEGYDPTAPSTFRNVHLNVAFTHRGRRIVCEVQLHLRVLFLAGQLNHRAYEVSRAEHPCEVYGPLHFMEISRNCTRILSDARAVASASVTAPVFYGNFAKIQWRPTLRCPTARASKAHRPTKRNLQKP